MSKENVIVYHPKSISISDVSHIFFPADVNGMRMCTVYFQGIATILG